MELCAFSVFIPFLGKFSPKIQDCYFKVKFDTWTNSNTDFNGGVNFISVLEWEYFLIQKLKIVRLS